MSHLKRLVYGLLIIGLIGLTLGVSPARAEPSDPFVGASPSFDTASQESTDYNVGDWGVAEQQGTATYTFPIEVPPGRNGMAPSLALRYSSRSSLRGGIAAGWTLDIPAIRIDRSLGHEDELRYRALLGAVSGRLVEAPDVSPYPGKAYRVEFDNSFTRFFHSMPEEFEPGPRGWVALTPNGVRHYFEVEPGTSDNHTRWHITRQVDPFGNTVRYYWARVFSPFGIGKTIDLSLDRIEYTSNEAAGLDAHAKVEFEYAPLDTCAGSEVPIGAAYRHNTGREFNGYYEGARRLTAIATYVRDEPGSEWRLARRVSLTYELSAFSLPPTGEAIDPDVCRRAKLRYLTQIDVTAYDPQGDATNLPPVTFEYNLNSGIRQINKPGYSHYGTLLGAESTRLDIDNDGIQDRVSVVEEAGICTLVWRKGLLGGAFEPTERRSSLPTVPWMQGTLPRRPGEGCTINGQVAYRLRDLPGGVKQPEKGILSYHFMDVTGDGRLDLLTNVWAAICHDTYVPDSEANCFSAMSAAAYPLVDDDPPGGSPTALTPEKDGDDKRYVWRVYRNAADPGSGSDPLDPTAVFSPIPMKVLSPKIRSGHFPPSLPPSASDDRLDPSFLALTSIPTLFDLDNDGCLDFIDVGSLPRLGEVSWTVHFGTCRLWDDEHYFRDEKYTWPALIGELSYGKRGYHEVTVDAAGEKHVYYMTVAALSDVNGDGLPDLVAQLADHNKLYAYINYGSGFSRHPLDLGLTVPVEETQTDYTKTSAQHIIDGNRGYRQRMTDMDGDGQPDLVVLAAASDDVTQTEAPVVHFYVGDRFLAGRNLPSSWSKGQRLFHFEESESDISEWALHTDFVDGNGDGRPDNVRWFTYGLELPDLAVKDFDGDDKDDVFYADGSNWYVSYSGTEPWRQLNTSSIRRSDLAFGDFKGNGVTDVFSTVPNTAGGFSWQVSYGGTGPWETINQTDVGLPDLVLADLDGDGMTDALRTVPNTAGGFSWQVSYGSTGPWETINQTGVGLPDLATGDFNFDGAMDVFIADGQAWYVSYSGTDQPLLINTSTFRLPDLALVDADGDGRTDVFRATGQEWLVSYGGTGPWQKLNTFQTRLPNLAFGHFDLDGGGTDVFQTDGSQWYVSYGSTGPWRHLVGGGYPITSGDIASAAPGALIAVENGRGMRVEFSYAPSTDPEAVSWEYGFESAHLPYVLWVVTEMKVSAGHGTPDMVTRYTYGDPAFLSPSEYSGQPEPHRFMGMRRTETTLQTTGGTTRRQVVRQYVYQDPGDPSGRFEKEWTYHRQSGTLHLHQYKEIAWKREPLFSGQVFFTHRDVTLTYTCNPGASTESECMEDIHRVQETWMPESPSVPPGGIGDGPPPPELYMRVMTQEGSGPAEGEGDRRTQYRYQIRYGQDPFPADDYRVLTTRTTLEEAVGVGGELAFVPRGKTETEYDLTTGLPVRTDEWQDEATPASTVRAFDPTTGNLLSRTKPVQASSAGSGNFEAYSYDPHQLFVQEMVNELGHRIMTTNDVATGALLERRGPNFVTLPSSETVWERETYGIDGFGRVLTHAVPLDDEAAGYALHVIDKASYFDFESPNRVREEHLRDFGDDTSWVTTDRALDGLGRVLSETQLLEGDIHAVTAYEYDEHGNLVAIEVPDPRDDGERVSFTYTHDGLGRLTGFTRPDGNVMSIAYAGLEKTIEEAGSTKKEVYDVFGRLVEVHEFDPEAEAAITRYQYDALDNLIQITDAEGNVTLLEHDWAGNRTSITRGDRAWRYDYDLNRNLLQEISPVPPGKDPSQHSVLYEYDDLDRVTVVRYNDVDIADAADAPGPEGTYVIYLPLVTTGAPSATPPPVAVQYFYDEGPNGTGRLSRVVLSFGELQYAYDARGLVIAEQRSFAISDVATVSATQRIEREYNALGQPTRSTWDDGQQWQISYDTRGLVATVEWYDPSAGTWQGVADYDRSLAGLPRTRGSSFGQVRHYTYDILGRPAQDTVSILGGEDPIATRAYTYTDSGDLASVAGDTNGVSAAASYTYDAQHRLIAATGPNGYAGAFTYSPAGNLMTADVTWNGSSETRQVRYEYGDRDPQAVDRLVNIGDDIYAHFTYDLSGNMTERHTPEGTLTLRWDGLDRIRTAEGPDGAEVYYYDHDGARMLAVSEADGVRFWFAESETHYDLDGGQTRRYLHLSGGGPTLARVEDGTEIELQYADALQNLMFSLDPEGNVVASFLYGPFGEVVQATAEEDHRRQFNGKENDAVTGLRYYGFRYYDPLTLRWNSADLLYRFVPDLGLAAPQRMNLYTFSLNNPVRYYDPDGFEADEGEGENSLMKALFCFMDENSIQCRGGTRREENSEETEETPDHIEMEPMIICGDDCTQTVFVRMEQLDRAIEQLEHLKQEGDKQVSAAKVALIAASYLERRQGEEKMKVGAGVVALSILSLVPTDGASFVGIPGGLWLAQDGLNDFLGRGSLTSEVRSLQVASAEHKQWKNSINERIDVLKSMQGQLVQEYFGENYWELAP